MNERKQEIVKMIEKCPNIIEVFGHEFLFTAIQSYEVNNECKWSPQNYFLANYLMSVSNYKGPKNYITELESMLNFFLSKHRDYIKSQSVLSRLTSKKEPTFQGRWSELIFAYFLNSKNIDIISISKTEQTKYGEVELFDIKTSCGEIEITTIMSEKGKVFDTDDVIFGMSEIGGIEKQLVNRKIKNKSGKKILAIDCTLVDELNDKLVEGKVGFPINFNIFKSTSKKVILFMRDSATQQVSLFKIL
jgi:hypothetical protein